MTDPGPPPYGPPPYGPPPYGYPPYGYPSPYPYIEKPTGWFIVNWLFFWPTAIYSLVKHWSPMDYAAHVGDQATARMHAAAIRRLGIWALCIGVVTTVLYLVVFIGIAVSIGY